MRGTKSVRYVWLALVLAAGARGQVPPPTITTASLPNAITGTTYAASVTATGGTLPHTFSIFTGTLPAGLGMNSAGAFSGIPSATGTSSFVVQVSDAVGQSALRSLSITVVDPLTITTASLPGGTTGTTYTASVSATGGTSPYTFLIASGSLPAGLTMNSAGAISGTPTGTGTANFTVQASDSGGLITTRALSITVLAPLSITTTSLPNGITGTTYAASVAATGGTLPHTFAIFSGALPAGLSMNPGGAISGTPSATGSSSFIAMVTDSMGQTATRSLSITIVLPPLTITSTSPLPDATAGIAYSFPFAATGGSSPSYIWSLASGNLPAGMSLSPAGVLNGTPGTPGTTTFVIQVATTAGESTTKSFILTVRPSSLTITTTALPGAILDQSYSATLVASGGTPPYVFSIYSGLPSGLVLNSNTGAITGIPTIEADSSFTAMVTDSTGQVAQRSLSIRVTVPTLSITTQSLPPGVVGVPYTATFSEAGGRGTFTWAIAGGALPPGITLSPAGALTGTPTAAGTFNFAVEVSDSGGQTAATGFTLLIRPGPLTITTNSPLPSEPAGGALNQPFTATGGEPPYAWSVSGELPPGSRLSAAGILIGTPNAVGTYHFTVRVTDARSAVATKSFSITITPPALSITTTSLPGGTAGSPYSAPLSASGGSQPYRWSAEGLPAGLSMDPGSGSISGTPTAAGAAAVRVTVTDSQNATATREFSLTVDPSPITITTASPLARGNVGTPYSQSFAASGGTGPYAFTLAGGALPPGLTFAAGALGGSPTATGTFNFTLRATDAGGAAGSKAFSLTIGPPLLTITTTALPAATLGEPYSQSISAGGGAPPVRFSGSGLPDGLTLDAAGLLSGTPAAPGSASITVTATDSLGATANRVLTLAINLPAAPAGTFSGLTDVADPARQPQFQFALAGTYPVEIRGEVTLTFSPDAGPNDPAVQFSSGGRTARFTVPAGSNTANFTVPDVAIQTGTVAGTITLTARLEAGGQNITPAPPPTRTIRVNSLPPTLTSVRAVRTGNGFDVQIVGFVTSRQVTQAIFRFTASSGGNLQTTEVTVPVEAVFSRWFQDPASGAFGSQFSFTQSFTIQGDSTAVGSVSVTLVNQQGNSQAVSATL